MTRPDERTRNLLQAGAYLKELAASQAVPKAVRQEAYRLLRHYPTVSDIEAIAEHEERLRALTQSAFVRPYLSTEIEADWFSGDPLGPHRI